MKYDFAILGAGAAGLSLALELVNSPLRDKSILIIDKEVKDTNDRTLSFWTDQPSRFDAIAYKTWQKVRFASLSTDQSWDISPFRYEMVRGLDFYRFAREELENHNVSFVLGEGEVEDGHNLAQVKASGQVFQAGWVFDSRFSRQDLIVDQRYHFLKQHFTGWVIETEQPVFDPKTATLLDLRTPQRGGLTFFYTIPFSETRALVEYTLFSPDLLPASEYEDALKNHLEKRLDLQRYRVESVERGVVPMTDRPFRRRLGQRILSIGTRGGRVKPSTGYAFSRIQRDSHEIVESLIHTGHPFHLQPDAWRYRFFDTVILEVLEQEPQWGEPIFSAIFARNPGQRVLKFLDNSSSLAEDLKILASPKRAPFVRALLRLAGKKIGLYKGDPSKTGAIIHF